MGNAVLKAERREERGERGERRNGRGDDARCITMAALSYLLSPLCDLLSSVRQR
jgi:hypothetical protein